MNQIEICFPELFNSPENICSYTNVDASKTYCNIIIIVIFCPPAQSRGHGNYA